MPSVPDRLAALERRLSQLEGNPAASLRFGSVTGVEGGFARVQLPDGQNMVSALIPTVQARVLKDQNIKMPDIGEPVAVLFSGQGLETGVVLGACYSPVTPDPGQPAHMDYAKYEDGTELWYDRKAHKLIAKVKGDADIETEGRITAKAKKEIRAESEVNITLKAPTIMLAGLLRVTDKDGKPGFGELMGTYAVRQGDFHVPDGDATAGPVSLRDHVHGGVESGPSITDKPVEDGGNGGGDTDLPQNNLVGEEEAFNENYADPLPDASQMDNLLLCIPEIAFAQSQDHASNADDRQGWANLRGMLHKWFSGDANENAEDSPEVFWVDMDWVLSYWLARNEYNKFVQPETLLSPAAWATLAKILHRNGYLSDKAMSFDFTKPPLKPVLNQEKSPWFIWEDTYFHSWKVEYILPDGIMACLGRFNFWAFASGATDPLPNGGHKITVDGVAIAVRDAFDFDKVDDLGYWNCEDKAFRYSPTRPGMTQVTPLDFQNFRKKHKKGHDFLVFSKPRPVAGFPRKTYDTNL